MKFQRRRDRKSNRGPVKLKDLIKKAEEYDDKYLDVVIHSLDLYEPDRRYELAQEFLSRKNRGAFHLTNPHSKKLWLPELIQSFLSIKGGDDEPGGWQEALEESKVACSLVTLTHEDWACADTNIQFDLGRAKQKVRNALAGTNFIARFEAAPYQNEDWETDGVIGKLICFHCHAIAWSSSRSDLDRVRSYIKPRFKPILGKEAGAHFAALKTEGDLVTALAYEAKMPLLGKRTVTNDKGKTTQRTSSRISYRTHRHLFHALKNYDLFQFWLAGGRDATGALRQARNRVKEKHKPHEFRARGIPRSNRSHRGPAKYAQPKPTGFSGDDFYNVDPE